MANGKPDNGGCQQSDPNVKRLKSILIHFPRLFRLAKALRHPLSFLYGAYLTIRYVDQYQEFPAITFRGGLIRLRISKGRASSLVINEKLTVEPWMGGRAGSLLIIADGAKAVFSGEFVIGDDVRIAVFEGAELLVGGRYEESGSGITARSVILVYQRLEIGRDCIIAWDTFLTDCDWHPIEGSSFWEPTSVGEHVWIAPGAKVLKGANIGANTIVGSQSVVTSGDYPPHSVIAGAKAKVVRSGVKTWRRDFDSHLSRIMRKDA